MKKKYLSAILFLFFLSNEVNSQTITFFDFTGSMSSYNIADVQKITFGYSSFSSGAERKEIKIFNNLSFLPLLCYEIIYSGKIFNNSNFDLMVNISEDGWFGSSIGPKQHFAHSIFRAVENGKYILRSANNGIAAIINPLGIVEKKVKFGNSGFVDFSESRKIQPTVFSKYGNKIFLLITLLYIFLIFSFNRINNE